MSTTTTTRAAAAATAAAPTLTVPPLDHWVSPGVMGLINSAPGNPNLRGLVRSELNVVPPRDITPTTAAWGEFLKRSFTESRPYLEKLKQYFDAKATPPRLYDPASSGTDTPNPTARAVPPVEAAPRIEFAADGSYVLPGVRMTARENGSANFECTVVYTGNVRIPADVGRQGPAAVRQWLMDNRERLVTERVLEESTENYLYENWRDSQIEVTEAVVAEPIINEAQRQIAQR